TTKALIEALQQDAEDEHSVHDMGGSILPQLTDKVQYGKSFAQSLVAAVLFVGYDTVMISRTGQTLGKRLLHLRVANLDNGATPSVQTTLIRSLVLWIPFAFCCACIWTAIAGGWSFFDRPYKQGLHDKAAKTVVVSTGA
ncbi:RDD family protein, partial [Streptomyces nigra]